MVDTNIIPFLFPSGIFVVNMVLSEGVLFIARLSLCLSCLILVEVSLSSSASAFNSSGIV